MDAYCLLTQSIRCYFYIEILNIISLGGTSGQHGIFSKWCNTDIVHTTELLFICPTYTTYFSV